LRAESLLHRPRLAGDPAAGRLAGQAPLPRGPAGRHRLSQRGAAHGDPRPRCAEGPDDRCSGADRGSRPGPANIRYAARCVFGWLHGDRESLQCRGMMTFTELAPAPSDPPEPFTDRLRLAGLPTWPASTAPPASTPNPISAATSHGAPSAAWTRWPLAQAAGIQVTRAHPHMFRHTVGHDHARRWRRLARRPDRRSSCRPAHHDAV
jgi:hypothetical protein